MFALKAVSLVLKQERHIILLSLFNQFNYLFCQFTVGLYTTFLITITSSGNAIDINDSKWLLYILLLESHQGVHVGITSTKTNENGYACASIMEILHLNDDGVIGFTFLIRNFNTLRLFIETFHEVLL